MTTCTQCAFGYYSSATQCIVCNAPCATCSDSTVCLSCIPGYDYTAGIFPYCTCGALCLNCTAQLFDCIDCMLDASYVLTDCLACMTGSYLANSTFCDTCPTNCVSCTSPLLCTSCLLPLVLLNNDCVCNSILGYYPNAGTCELCPNIITNCNSCSQLPNTTIVCVTCDSTYYLPSANCCVAPVSHIALPATLSATVSLASLHLR